MLKMAGPIILMPLWILLSGIFAIVVYRTVMEFYVVNVDDFLFLFVGLGTYLISMFIIKPIKYKFWDTFFHEISHMLFAILTFAKPLKLVVSPDEPENGVNGYARYQLSNESFLSRYFRGHIVGLAPYFFSPITLLLVLIYWMVIPDKQSFLSAMFAPTPTLHGLLFLIGLTYMYHLRTALKQARPHQTDFHVVGYLYGMVFVCFVQLLFLTFFICVISINFGSFEFVFGLIQELIIDALEFARRFVGPLIQ